jgi:hypothetical protein
MEQNGSNISGRAVLLEIGGSTRVQASVTGSAEYPAHIHEGTCANLNPVPKWPLISVVNGTSTTEVPASLGEITRQPTAINLHASSQDLNTYVACGDIKR